MAEWTSAAVQTVNPGEAIVFTNTVKRCNRGLVLHRDDSGGFTLRGVGSPMNNGCGCGCCNQTVDYMVDFGANIAIPTGQTVGPISVAFSLEGNTLTGTTMEVTPAAVEEFFNVSRAASVQVWKGCCPTFSIRNTSPIPILVEAANLVIKK